MNKYYSIENIENVAVSHADKVTQDSGGNNMNIPQEDVKGWRSSKKELRSGVNAVQQSSRKLSLNDCRKKGEVAQGHPQNILRFKLSMFVCTTNIEQV